MELMNFYLIWNVEKLDNIQDNKKPSVLAKVTWKEGIKAKNISVLLIYCQ